MASTSFYESLDKVNRALRKSNDLEQVLSDTLDAVLSIFGCDRAFLLYPCDPEASSFHVPMERTTSRYPGILEKGPTFQVTPPARKLFQALLDTDGTVESRFGREYGPGDEPFTTYEIRSMLAIALHPNVGKPWEFGLHQCSHIRAWAPEEKRLFQEIGRRLTDGLSSLLMHRDLEQSREFLDNIVENIPDMVFVKDAETLRFVRFNKAGEELLGYSREEFLGRNDYDFFPKEEADFFTARDRQALDGKRLVDVRGETIRTRSKGERILHTKKIPVLDKTGKPQYLLGISEDITERVKNEIELQETKERLQTFMDSATDSMSIFDPELQLIDLNKKALSRLPATMKKEDILGMRLDVILKSFNISHNTENVRNVLETGEPLSEDVMIEFGGRKQWLTIKAFRVGINLGIVTSDITAQKTAEEEVRRIKERLQSFLDSASDIILSFDSDLNLTLINQKALSIFPGSGKEAFLGRHISEFMGSIDNKDFPGLLKRVLDTGDPCYSEERVTFRPNDPRWIDFSIFKVGDGLGVIGTDITERKRLEEQLLQAQKMESIGRLAGGVAHDYNNMLSIILGHTELALGGMDTADPLFGHIREIRKAAERSADLTRQLLAFARKQIVAPRVLDLNGTLEGMLKMLRSLIGEHIDLVWRPAKTVWAVRIDPSQVDQLLANLCVNARDAIADVGSITIETKNVSVDDSYRFINPEFLPGDFVMLSVRDDGAGMDEETRKKIFEPFFTTKELGKGTGLGLSIVYGIVKQNNGFVDVLSKPGAGTTFRIFLPRSLPGPKQAPAEFPPARSAQGRETILLVEDEPEILAMASMMLENFGYGVLAVPTPEEALRVAREHGGEIHLLISDVIMPGMNGRVLAGRVSALRPKIRSLFMSGYTDDFIAGHGALGANVHFLQKPFSMQSMADKVREVLDDAG